MRVYKKKLTNRIIYFRNRRQSQEKKIHGYMIISMTIYSHLNYARTSFK